MVKLGGEFLLGLLQQRRDCPVFDRLERADLALALDDESQRHRLHTPRRQALLHRFPEHGARLVTDQPVEHTPRLLRFDLLLVDVARVVDGAADGVPRDLVEQHPSDWHVHAAALGLDLQRDMRSDRLPLAIGVGRDENLAGILRRGLQLGDGLFLPRNRNELGLETDVDAELLFREVHDVTDRRPNAETAPEVLADGLRLRRRFDDDERCRTSRRWRALVIRHIGRIPAAAALAGRRAGWPSALCARGQLACRRAGF